MGHTHLPLSTFLWEGGLYIHSDRYFKSNTSSNNLRQNLPPVAFQQAHNGVQALGYDSFVYSFLAAGAAAVAAVGASCDHAEVTKDMPVPVAIDVEASLLVGVPPSLSICIPLREQVKI